MADDLNARLRSFVDGLVSSGAVGVAVATRDGLPVVERLPSGSFADSVCAMAAAALAAAETAFDEGRAGRVDRAWVEGPDHIALLQGLNDRLLLTVLLEPDADRADVLAQIRDGLQKIRVAVG